MEVLTKKTISIEFGEKKFAISDDATIEEILIELGLPKENTVRLRVTKDGFALIS